MTLDDALQTFIVESGELLDAMEHALLSISGAAQDGAQPDAEAVNAIFRAAHTIKGSAGLFGIDHVVAFTHVAESVLDAVRLQPCLLDDQLITLLLACRDHLGAQMAHVAEVGIDPDPALEHAGQPLLEQLRQRLGAGAHDGSARGAGAPAAAQGDSVCWMINLTFGEVVLQNGMDPMSFLRYLGTIGTVEQVQTSCAAMPALELMDPEACYLSLHIKLRSDATRAQIDAVFDFVRDDCVISITAPDSVNAATIERIEADQSGEQRLGEALLLAGGVTQTQLARALLQQATGAPDQQIGQLLINQGAVAAPVVAAALARQGKARDASREAKSLDGNSIRVDADKLDHLINLVGELIITTASANLIARRGQNVEFQECGSTLSALVEEVRNSALQLRMVKIGATFNRFARVVHDVARELGKDIALQVSGEDTELDKTVVEKIGDPLTHLVRNAMDHGIESAELRAERGKPACGAIALHAYHDAGTIVIEVSDDGGGLKRERIVAKAIERGLIEAGRVLTDEEVFALVFEPGFSTAEQVTNLSGRGVGMDVVKRNITALRGSVSIASTEGMGTTVTVRLPLTLAIINGFQVAVGRSTFVIPLDMVDECVELRALDGHDVADLRGQVLPLIRLRQCFSVSGNAGPRQSVVVVKYAGQRAGIVVDGLLGESQTVIKPLGKLYQHLDCISGSSILGSGEVALILDVPALIRATAAQGATPQAEVAMH